MKTKNFFRSKFSVFYILALVARDYLTNPIIFVSSILPPLLTYFTLSLILHPNNIIGLSIGIAMSAVISTGVLTFAVSFFEWRNSVIYKKVKISLISEVQFYLAFSLFYLLISFVMFWVLIGFVLFNEKMKYVEESQSELLFKQIQSITSTNWMWIFLALFQLSLISILIGLLISLLVSTAASAQAIGLAFYLTVAFVTSCYISLSISAKVDFLRNYGNIFPVYPSVHAIQGAWLANVIPVGDTIDEISASEAGQLWLKENPNYVLSAEITSLKWTRETDEGLEFLNWKKVWHNPFERREYTKFSILGPYWGHALASLGWTVVFVIAIAMVKKFKYNRG